MKHEVKDGVSVTVTIFGTESNIQDLVSNLSSLGADLNKESNDKECFATSLSRISEELVSFLSREGDRTYARIEFKHFYIDMNAENIKKIKEGCH